MRRWCFLLLWCGLCGALAAQENGGRTAAALTFNNSIGLPGSKAQVYAAALKAWDNSFGLEPGARLVITDPENGVVEGTARMNYRSALLLNREETTGSVSYTVHIECGNGTCSVRVSGLKHTGNRNARGGGLDIGPILSGPGPAERPVGMGWTMARKAHEEIQNKLNDRIPMVIRNLLSQVRSLSGE
jgi:hypothetical protein